MSRLFCIVGGEIIAVTYKTCIKCGEKKASTQFYKHKNELIGQKFSLCKDCIKAHCKSNDIEVVHDVLRTLDIPFVITRWESLEGYGENRVGEYLKRVNNTATYRDSKYKHSNKVEAIEELKTYEGTIEIDEELQQNIKFWGNKRYSIDDYEFLNEAYKELCQDRKPNSFTTRNAYKNIARTQLQAQKALEEGNSSEYDKLVKTLSTIMGDANVKPVQTAGENSGTASWGETVKRIEEQRPCLTPSDEFNDVDKIGYYMNKFFTKHMNRVFGLDNSPVTDDLDEDFKKALQEEVFSNEEEEESDGN